MAQPTEVPAAAVRRLLTQVLRTPQVAVDLPLRELDLVLRAARRVRLLGRLATKLRRDGLLEALPPTAREQLASSLVIVDARARITRWELTQLERAFAERPDMRVVVLKGCAYLLAGLPNAEGRAFADVDLLIAESELGDAERMLLDRGWRGTNLTAYDQHYYRAWTHELPPLVHVEREVEADLHHNILPRTSRLKPRGDLLLAGARPIAGQRFARLADRDVVLHAITHLFFDSDFADSLRDLVDVDDLLRSFAARDERFWDGLWERAKELDLARPAFYALRYCRAFLDTPVPDAVLLASRGSGPPAPVLWLMDRLVPRALFPMHPDAPSRTAELARILLYIRSQWIRMPPLLLARHLCYKFYVRRIKGVLRAKDGKGRRVG